MDFLNVYIYNLEGEKTLVVCMHLDDIVTAPILHVWMYKYSRCLQICVSPMQDSVQKSHL